MHTHIHTDTHFGTCLEPAGPRKSTLVGTLGHQTTAIFSGLVFKTKHRIMFYIFKDVATYLSSILTLFKKAIEIWLVVWNMSVTLW